VSALLRNRKRRCPINFTRIKESITIPREKKKKKKEREKLA